MADESKTKWALYEEVLTAYKRAEKDEAILNASDSLIDNAESSPSFHKDTKLNNITTSMYLTRDKTTQCNITMLPNTTLYPGDIIDKFNEKWLVTDVYKDEYNITYGKALLCNYLCKFQNQNSTVINSYGVLDDGTYTLQDKKEFYSIKGKYRLYLTSNSQTDKIHIDKRLAIGKIYNKNQEVELSVIKVIWIDNTVHNNGYGSHLLVMDCDVDVFNHTKDNLNLEICDYLTSPIVSEPIIPEENEEFIPIYSCNIVGNDTIRIGTQRTYDAIIKDQIGNIYDSDILMINFDWEITPNNDSFTVVVSNNLKQCTITMPLVSELIGSQVNISLSDTNDVALSANKILGVISIGI